MENELLKELLNYIQEHEDLIENRCGGGKLHVTEEKMPELYFKIKKLIDITPEQQEELDFDFVTNYIQTDTGRKLNNLFDEIRSDLEDYGFVDSYDLDNANDEIIDLKNEICELNNEIYDLENIQNFGADNLYDEERALLLQDAYKKFNLNQLQEIFEWKPVERITKKL